MSSRAFAAAFVVLLAQAAAVHAQSTLADRIQSGDRAAALAMIAKGVDVNQTQVDGTTPLHWAVYRVDRELVAALLKKGARAHAVNKYGASPLAEAVRRSTGSGPVTPVLRRAAARAESASPWAELVGPRFEPVEGSGV